MRGQRSKIIIGVFVLGGIGLVIAALVLFGTGRLFARSERYILYFDESVTGLIVGAPVLFRGVEVGRVAQINLEGDLEALRFLIPIIVDIQLERFDIKMPDANQEAYHQALIDKGLRAQLRLQSILTGQMLIHLDFFPDRPARIVPDARDLKQIPTVPSPPAALVQRLQELPLEQLVTHANNALAGLDRLVNAPQMIGMPERLDEAVNEAIGVMRTLEQEVGLLSADARQTIETAATALERIEQVWTTEEGAGAELVKAATETLREAGASLKGFDEAMQAFQETAADERTYYQLQQTLRNVSQAAESLHRLADFLGRHPEALLRGRPNPDGEGR